MHKLLFVGYKQGFQAAVHSINTFSTVNCTLLTLHVMYIMHVSVHLNYMYNYNVVNQPRKCANCCI